MNLDINSEKGKQTLVDEREMHEELEKILGGKILETDKSRPAKIDGLHYIDNTLQMIFEAKCRYDMDFELLNRRGSLLITKQKVDDGKNLSRLLQVPYVVIVYLVKTKTIVAWKLTNDFGDDLFEYESKNFQTQRTVNGGQANRMNSFLPVKFMQIIKQ